MWATIAVSSDAEWTRFCQAIGNPSWTKDERFSDALGRWQNQDELDKRIEEWTSEHDHYEVMRILQEAGVAAGALLNPAELLEDPHLKARGFFEVVDRDVVGKYPYPRSPIRLSKTKVSTRIPAPCLGEHNEYVLGQLLGMSKEEMTKLAEEKIIGTEPVA
jgi:crotonobetainyl-CoA:carnitine CoA-transferase CaiB-like acyl-CoA transferase